ncbi:HD domain-containing protein [Candidatus Pacearchaeota archaeon]|nr:HD domain-containing protein [Candidatus Pacearchaeota archaeon]
MEITDIVRSGHTYRWQIVRTHRKQSIAEHMYQTAMLADLIAREVTNWGDDKRNHLIWCALIHDLPEVMSGDIPTPAKRKIITKDIEAEFWEGRRGKPKKVDETAITILKIADLVEASLFILIEGVDQKAKNIGENLMNDALILVEIAFKENKSGWIRAKQKILDAEAKIKIGNY